MTTTATTATKEAKASRDNSLQTTLIFQDVVFVNLEQPQHEENCSDEALSLAFFELANVQRVGYRLSSQHYRKPKKTTIDNSTTVMVHQDHQHSCGQHTGGIVWETSYLLLNYFLLHHRRKLGRTLEVGAGCGLLGQVLATSGWSRRPVILTEAPDAMKNLKDNGVRCNDCPDTAKVLKPSKLKKGHRPMSLAFSLDWLHAERDIQAFPEDVARTFDTIVGTDVIFAPSLVEPLLTTLTLLSRENTIVYLCLQVRCSDSHALLLELAKDHGWRVSNLTSTLASIQACAWGLQMECQLLQLTRSTNTTTSKRKANPSPQSKHHDASSGTSKKKRNASS